MVSENIDEAGLRTLGQEWNANLIRWQLIRHAKAGKTFALDEVDAWLDGELKKLDAALPLCEKYGLKVVIDLHSPPGGTARGGYSGSNDRLFTDRACQDKLVQIWQLIAKRYRNAKVVWGYDLANEPEEGRVSEDCDVWQDLAERVARAIREIDPERTIIVESSGGNTNGFLFLEPLTVPRVVYSVHMYEPCQFTGQNLRGGGKPVSYPDQIDGQEWNKARLEEALRPVLDFQKTYNAHIFVGEFSAIRWAPGDSARDYLRDVIDIFESHGWDWAYHAFREWHGWSVEHTGDRNDDKPAAQPTDREKLLRQWYAKNQKP
jgi:aryl-phospho-beta-D-glucosidase BglC (GH1 family)